MVRPLLAFLLFNFAPVGECLAQASPGEADKSGTNPAVLTRSFNLLNEYLALPTRHYLNTTTLRYTEPFADGKMSLRFDLPVAATNLLGGTTGGLGDMSGKWTWVPYIDRQQAIVLSNEIFAPTAGSSALGTGKWVTAPGFTYVYFASKEFIIAPAFVHNVSFAGDDLRKRVNRTDFDLYVVYKPAGQSWWITSDFTLSYDFMTQMTPSSLKVALGKNVGKLGDAAVNLSVKPGVGFGRDRAFDWGLEVGLAIVGF